MSSGSKRFLSPLSCIIGQRELLTVSGEGENVLGELVLGTRCTERQVSGTLKAAGDAAESQKLKKPLIRPPVTLGYWEPKRNPVANIFFFK